MGTERKKGRGALKGRTRASEKRMRDLRGEEWWGWRGQEEVGSQRGRGVEPERRRRDLRGGEEEAGSQRGRGGGVTEEKRDGVSEGKRVEPEGRGELRWEA